MKAVTDPALLEMLNADSASPETAQASQQSMQRVSDPALLEQLNSDGEKGYIDSRVEAFKQLKNPEWWKQIGHDLTNFPKDTPDLRKQVMADAEESALNFLPVTRVANATRSALFNPGNVYGKPSEASAKLLKAFQRDKLDTGQLSKQLDELGPEATLADVGGANTTALARASAALPGPGKNIAEQVLNQRQFGQSDRVTSQVSKSLGDGDLFHQNIDDLLEARKLNAKPLYEQAVNATNRIPAKEFGPIKRDEFIAGIMEKIKTDPLYKLGGLPDDSMPIIDATKKYIDRMVSSAKRGNNPNNYEVAKLVEKSNKLKDIADNSFPAYKRARDAFSGPTELVNALEDGRAFIRGDAEVTKATLSKLSKSEQEFFRVGAARALRDKVLNTPDTADTVKKIFSTPLMREKLEAVFPDAKEFANFEKMMQKEAQLFQTRNAVMSGSRTAPLQAEMGDTIANGVDASKILMDALKGNFGSAVSGAVRKLNGPTTLPPNVSEDLAGLMFAKGPAAKESLLSVMNRTHRDSRPPKIKPDNAFMDLLQRSSVGVGDEIQNKRSRNAFLVK